jgi:hypothetical protein
LGEIKPEFLTVDGPEAMAFRFLPAAQLFGSPIDQKMQRKQPIRLRGDHAGVGQKDGNQRNVKADRN